MTYTYSGTSKIVFCLLVSVMLCFVNYSLHYQYETSSQSIAVPSRIGLIRFRNTTPLIIAPDLAAGAGNTGLPTEAVLEANVISMQMNDTHRLTNELVVSPGPVRGTDTGQQVVIHPPTLRQLPSISHEVDIIEKDVENVAQVNSNHTSKTPSEEHNVALQSQTVVQRQSSEQRELVNLQLTHTTGFVVPLRIYEQQTMASGNLMQLQCWAKLLNLAVVKPFTKDSFFSLPLDETKHSTMLTLADTFDMEDWSQHTGKLGYAPLVDWSYFVQKAPRDAIFVQIKYPTLTHVKAILSQGCPFPHPPTGNDYKEGCRFKMLTGKTANILEAMSFRVVRKVCFNFLTGSELSLKQFHADILGGYRPGDVTIFIDEWRGIKENQRVLIQDNICREENPYREYLKPSHHLLRDAQLYAKQFLQSGKTFSNNINNNNNNNNTANPDYLAIIARYEMTGLTRSLSRDNDPHAIIPHCLQLTLQAMEKVQRETGLTNTFLSIDIGKYGSKSFEQKHYYDHLEDMESFVGKVYNGRMDVHEWEKTFETVAHTTDAGYIAMLQEVLVVRAKCIIFVGGGSFQRHAFHLYNELHPNKEDRCYKVIEKCTTPYRPIKK